MKSKSLILVLVLLLTSLLVVMPVAGAAYYTDVTGQILDSDTHQPWAYGGTVYVWDCATYDGIPANASAVGGISTSGTVGSFTISSLPAANTLCIQIMFGTGPDGTPADKFFFGVSLGQTGTWDLGNIYTDTGPTAVTLNSVQSKSTSMWPALALVAAVAVVPSGLLRRKNKS